MREVRALGRKGRAISAGLRPAMVPAEAVRLEGRVACQIRVIKPFGPLAVQTSIEERRGNFVTSHGRLQISPFLMRKGCGHRSEITETKVVFFIQGDGSRYISPCHVYLEVVTAADNC